MRRVVVVLVVVAILAAAGVAALKLGRRVSPAPAASPPPASSAEGGTVKFLMEQQWSIRMKLAQARPATVARQITATGRVVPAAGRHAAVAPPVAGIITGTAVPRVGQQVERGHTIAVLQQTPTAAEAAQMATSEAQHEIEVTRLEADRRRLSEAVKEAELRVEHARLEFERAQRLFARKAYALRQVQAAEAEYRTAEAALAGAVAQHDALAQARVPARRSPRSSTSYAVQAPIAGTVTRVAKSVGEQVSAGDVILELVDTTNVWVEVPLFETDLGRLSRGVRAVFTTPAIPNQEFTGRLVDVGPVVQPDTRTATVIFEVPNPTRALRIGFQANVRLDSTESVQGLMVPREAVLESEGKRLVYVLVSGEEFQRREVAVGDEYGDQIAILSGLKAGERVVTQGAWQLRQHELRPAVPGAHTHE